MPRRQSASGRDTGQSIPKQTPTTRGLLEPHRILGRRGAGGTKKPPPQTKDKPNDLRKTHRMAGLLAVYSGFEEANRTDWHPPFKPA
jgi:hypothetical protein